MMTDTPLPEHAPGDPTPFEKFQQAFRGILSVSKEELDAEVAKEKAKRARKRNGNSEQRART